MDQKECFGGGSLTGLDWAVIYTLVVLALLSHRDMPCVAEKAKCSKMLPKGVCFQTRERRPLRLTRERSVPPCQGAWGLSPVHVCCGTTDQPLPAPCFGKALPLQSLSRELLSHAQDSAGA